MKIQNLSNSPKVPFDLDGHILHSEKQIELIHLLLKPGEKLDEHKNPFDVIFFVVEGSGTLTIESNTYKITATDVTKITSEKMRGLQNHTNNDLRILVIKLL